MNVLSIEIKTSIDNPEKIEAILKAKGAKYVGEDHQIDTYFLVDSGRLKLRQGKIENSLILYHRPESKDLKKSSVQLQKLPSDNEALKEILTKTIGVRTVVDKKRKIFFIENVKFHIDEVKGLGAFMEIEALDTEGIFSEKKLQEQCDFYIDFLKLDRSKFINQSYSEMVGDNQNL